MADRKKLPRLFWEMCRISACTFGGGFVVVTFMRRRFAEELRWLTEEEVLDMTALAQSCPGSIAVNAAIQVGQHVAGIPGVFAAVLGTILPPMLLLSLLSLCYDAFRTNTCIALMLRGMRAGVAAVILDTALSLGIGVVKEKDALHTAVMLMAFAAVLLMNVSAIAILLGALAVGIASSLLKRRSA